METPSAPAPRPPLITLDIARGLAAVMVLLVHLRGDNWVEFGALPAAQRSLATALFFGLTRLGDEAVMVFFVLSGFLVGGKLIERARAGDFDLAHYAVDRGTRILIPLVPACLLTAATAGFLIHRPLSAADVVGNMIGLNGVLVSTLNFNAPLWSLAHEIWFYVIAGAVAFWFARKPSIPAAAAVGVAAICFAQLGATFLVFWTFGALISVALDLPRPRLLLAVGIALAVAGVTFYQLGGGTKSFVSHLMIPQPIAQGLICVGFSLTLPFLCKPATNNALRVLRTPASYLSAISYSLYLTHYPTISALDLIFRKNSSLTGGSFALFAIKAATCFAVAIGFYLLFERHTAAVRRAISRRLAQRRGLAERFTPSAQGRPAGEDAHGGGSGGQAEAPGEGRVGGEPANRGGEGLGVAGI